MQFPVPAYTSFTIPTGATTGARITFNENGNGKIVIYDGSGTAGVILGGPLADIISVCLNAVNKDIVIQNGIMNLGLQNDSGNWAQVYAELGDNALQIGSVLSAAKRFPSKFRMFPGVGGAVTGSANAPNVLLTSGGGTDADLLVSGTVIASDSTGVRDTWQSPVYLSTYVGTTTFNLSTNWATLQYRRDAEDNLIIIGAFNSGATPTGPVFNVPVGFRPTKQYPVTVLRSNAGVLTSGFAALGSSGNFNLVAASGTGVAANNDYLVTGFVPRGNLA